MHPFYRVSALGILCVNAFTTPLSVTQTIDANLMARTIAGAGITIVGTPALAGQAAQSGIFEAFTTGPYTNPVTDTSGTISIPKGVVLASGRVEDAMGNYVDGANTDLDGAGDAQLSALSGFDTNDAVSLTFSFIPDANEVFIQYVFASTEYPFFVNSPFNDVFGFFVNGVNVALVPESSDPVAVNKINGGNPPGSNASNAQYFTQYSNASTPFNYGGSTVLLVARASVNPGIVNTFKFAVADASDSILDSAVFIGSGQFTTTPPATPEPGTWGLIAGGFAFLAVARRRRAKHKAQPR